MFKKKKFILIWLILFLVSSSCLAETTQSKKAATKKHAVSIHHKIKKNTKHQSVAKKSLIKNKHNVIAKNKKTKTKRKSNKRSNTKTNKNIITKTNENLTKTSNKHSVNHSRPQQNSSNLVRIKHYPAQINSTAEIESKPNIGLVASIEQRLVGFVKRSVETLRYSAYKLGASHFDSSRGIYIVDCSAYVDHTLRSVYPNAYLSLVNSTGSDKPNTLNYYDFFKGLSDNDEFWSKVEDVEQLQPGDILVFRYKNKLGRSTGGHVMVVMNKPIRDGDTFTVSVADSAASGHSQDTRPGGLSGIGMGKLLLKINPDTGQPSAFAWKVGSRWKSNVNFAMARPTDIES